MILDVRIEKDKQTLSHWNFKEEALVLYDEHRHVALPISLVSGEILRKLIDEWNLPLFEQFLNKSGG